MGKPPPLLYVVGKRTQQPNAGGFSVCRTVLRAVLREALFYQLTGLVSQIQLALGLPLSPPPLIPRSPVYVPFVFLIKASHILVAALLRISQDNRLCAALLHQQAH